MANAATKKNKFTTIVRNELSRAEARDAQDVGANRAAALAMFRNAPLAKDETRLVNGLHVDQSSDLADMVNACLAQITPMLTTDSFVQFEPEGAQDEDQARAESAAVDNVIQSDNRGYVTFYDAFHDALLLKNGWIKVFTDEEITTRDMHLDGTEMPEEVAMLIQPKAPGETREVVDDTTIRITTTTMRFRICSVATEDMTYSANEDTTDVGDLRFLSERMLKTRSELVDMGFSKKDVYGIAQLNAETNIQSRRRNQTADEGSQGETPDQDVIECHESYVRADMNGDGVAELYRVFTAGSEAQLCLDYEEVDVVPYATGSPFLTPHRITGMSLYDRLSQVQNTKTKVLRMYLDDLQSNTYGRYIADDSRVNMEDLLNQSQIVRAQDPMSAVMPLRQHPAQGAEFNAALAYQDKMRSERGGASLDMQTAEMQIHGETAHGLERQVSLREMLTSMMSRNLAETLVRRVYVLMHGYLRNYSNAPLEMKLNGEWQEIDPRQWRERTRINVKVGLSAGEKSRKVAALTQVIQMQISAIENGKDGILTDESSMFNAMSDWALASDLDNPDSYLVNPMSQQAQQTKQQQAQQQQQMQQVQMQLAQMQAKQLEEAEKVKGEVDLLKHRDEMAYKYWADNLKSETEEAKIVAKSTTDLTAIQLQGEINARAAQGGAGEGSADPKGTTQ